MDQFNDMNKDVTKEMILEMMESVKEERVNAVIDNVKRVKILSREDFLNHFEGGKIFTMCNAVRNHIKAQSKFDFAGDPFFYLEEDKEKVLSFYEFVNVLCFIFLKLRSSCESMNHYDDLKDLTENSKEINYLKELFFKELKDKDLAFVHNHDFTVNEFIFYVLKALNIIYTYRYKDLDLVNDCFALDKYKNFF